MTSLLDGEEGRAGLVFLEEMGVLSYLWLSLLNYPRITHCISPGFYPLLAIKS